MNTESSDLQILSKTNRLLCFWKYSLILNLTHSVFESEWTLKVVRWYKSKLFHWLISWKALRQDYKSIGCSLNAHLGVENYFSCQHKLPYVTSMLWDHTVGGMYRSAVEDSCVWRSRAVLPVLCPLCYHLVVCWPLLTRTPPPPVCPHLVQAVLFLFGPPGAPWTLPAGLAPPLPF